MAWLPLYAADSDFDLLGGFLNQESDVAFVVSDGPGRWRAIPTASVRAPGRYCLWHEPSGPLPLLRTGQAQPGLISDPRSGWREERAGADPLQPYFGAGHPGILWLNVRPDEFGRHTGVRSIGLSSFEWIGRRYQSLGAIPSPSTAQWWRRLGAWVRRHSTKVPRGGLTQSSPPEIWALPQAFALLQTTAIGGNN